MESDEQIRNKQTHHRDQKRNPPIAKTLTRQQSYGSNGCKIRRMRQKSR